MSDYIQDMRDATELFNKWTTAPDHPLFEKDFKAIDTALQKAYDLRSGLFENMLKILERSGDDLESDWQRSCDEGLTLLRGLDAAISSSVSGGLKSIGLGSFFEGESKIWQKNRDAAVAIMAEAITQIAKSDDDLIKKLEQDLKTAREGGQVADEKIRVSLGQTKMQIRELTILAIEKGATKLISEIPKIGEKIAEPASKVIEVIIGSSEKTRTEGKNKAGYKDLLLNNRKMIEDLREKLNDEAIVHVLKDGVSMAYSLKDGATGDYKAADWARFGEECAKRLNARSDPAIGRAQYLYKNVYPAYIEGLTGAFASLASTPANLTALRDELDEETLKVFEALRVDGEVIMALHDPIARQTARQVLQKIRDDVEAAIKKLKDTIKDADERVRTGG
jgi:DNA-binding ferritin-like protein